MGVVRSKDVGLSVRRSCLRVRGRASLSSGESSFATHLRPHRSVSRVRGFPHPAAFCHLPSYFTQPRDCISLVVRHPLAVDLPKSKDPASLGMVGIEFDVSVGGGSSARRAAGFADTSRQAASGHRPCRALWFGGGHTPPATVSVESRAALGSAASVTTLPVSVLTT